MVCFSGVKGGFESAHSLTSHIMISFFSLGRQKITAICCRSGKYTLDFHHLYFQVIRHGYYRGVAINVYMQ